MNLSDRQKRVAKLSTKGLTASQIGERLGRTKGAIESTFVVIKRKTGLDRKNWTQLFGGEK